MNPAARKLHIGCFDQVFPGWINADVTPHLVIARIPGLARVLHWAGVIGDQRYSQHKQGVFGQVRYLNAAQRFPYDGESFDCIYSAHLLEHLYPRQANVFLRECRRVLRTGGVLRLAVPDLDQIVAAYDPRRGEEFAELLFESRHQRGKNTHHWQYNQHSLARALESAAFREIRRRAPREGSCPDVERIDSRLDSLFMEAIK